MTIQEAIKSGKAFKRKNSNLNIWYVQIGDFIVQEYLGSAIFVVVKDILADDWIVRE